jgi:tetratricopeptide (TPR) repeat protein
MKRSLRLSIDLSSLALLLFAATALGEETSDSNAHALFKEGRELAASGRYGEAADKFEASLKRDRGIGTEFNLADSWEHSGRERDAAELFARVAKEAHDAGQYEREEIARARAKVLERFAPREGTSAGLPGPAPMVIPLVVDSNLRSRAKAWAELQAEYGTLADMDAQIRDADSKAKRLQAENPADPRTRAVVARLTGLRSAIEAAWRQAGDIATRLGRGETAPPATPAARNEESANGTPSRLSLGSHP